MHSYRHDQHKPLPSKVLLSDQEGAKATVSLKRRQVSDVRSLGMRNVVVRFEWKIETSCINSRLARIL